jgi:tRNA A-37 threonylcarbamoyl transferase component Bud32
MQSPWYVDIKSSNFKQSIEFPEQLDDVIHGLEYLHSENIVHGDLCGVSELIVWRSIRIKRGSLS